MTVVLVPGTVLGAQRRVCVRADLAEMLWDASVRDIGGVETGVAAGEVLDIGEDFGRTDAPFPFALGNLLVRVEDAAGDPLFGWRPLGADGCTPWFDEGTGVALVRSVSWHHYDDTGTDLVVYDCDSGGPGDEPFDFTQCGLRRDAVPATMLAEAPDGTLAWVIDPRPAHALAYGMAFTLQRTHALAAQASVPATDAGQALYGVYWPPRAPENGCFRRGTRASHIFGGRPTVEFQNRSTGCTDGQGNPLFAQNNEHAKATVSHELGHLLTMQLPAGFTPTLDDGFNQPPGQGDHKIYSREWQATAAAEGFAHYVTYLAWNREGEPTAVFGRADGGDGMFDLCQGTESAVSPDCSPTVTMVSVHEAMYCPGDGTDVRTCPQLPWMLPCRRGVAVELDWANFLWRLHATGAIDPGELPYLLSDVGLWQAPDDCSYWLAFLSKLQARSPQAWLAALTLGPQMGVAQ